MAERRAKFETDPKFACRWLRSRKSIVSGSSGNNDSSVGLIARSWESFWGDVKQNSPEVLKLRRSLTSCFLTLSEALWIGTVRL